MSVAFSFRQEKLCSTMRENDLHYTRKHRRLGTNGSMTGAHPCNPEIRKEQ